MTRAPAAAALLLCLAARAASAQRLVGTLLHAADSTPLAGALVEVRGPQGFASRSVTSERGAFVTAVPAEGRYLVTVLRVGHEPWRSDSVHVARAAQSRRFYVPDDPIVLRAITVEADRGRCGVPPSGSPLGQLLAEADKAIALTATTMDARRLVFTVHQWQRRLSPERFTLDSIGMISADRGWPVRSAPPESLRVWGFVRDEPDAQGQPRSTYYGPDARVLFADWFLGTHCLRLRGARVRGQPLLEVEFTPERERRDIVDIAGRFVFDSVSLELRELHWRWVGLPDWVPRNGPGGYIEFRRLAAGGWLTGEWSMWAPVPEVTPDRARFREYAEWGGRVSDVRQPSPSPRLP